MNPVAQTPDLPTEIREQRIAAGLTQQTLADLAGISVGNIRNWEQGRELPREGRSLALRLVRGVLAGLQNDEGRPHQGALVQEPVEQDRHAAA